MTSNRPVSEMVERVRDVFASYDLDDFNRWSDRGVERFTREIIEAASSQAPSDAQARNLTRMQDGRIMTDEEIARAAIPPKPAIPPAVASDDWLVRQLEAWPARVDPEKTTNIEYLMKEAAKRLAAIPPAGGVEERLREALRQIARGSRRGLELFDQRVKERKDRLTWFAVNVLQDNLSACEGTAKAVLDTSASPESTGK